ncbi:MAG TPA: prepilin-type cleavage/methylation domain-containing protein [Cyanobacteria bacterium UBA11149]|nr:prepilin-type cleavage/methylation domain-containing protein [Cyanobacteria bacterium UBA11367]HBE60245.1 prepilin-type cleavage/methylation domain-containing protein [Cyanobacteria bacterium UBA11366]HBK66496.1 prepilin-type cleavage/methylation domain-containing protein [Cyanobacteria bacterium UBA11166]HBR76899.1 prepilin-type cleavage/methylation domain-containing protein [Cyanobacteria bacterium UBA11159]HBS70453.1 prepilin-type cleavage/methylation domain-containing protein [Cyanobacte
MSNPVSLKTNSWQKETRLAKLKPFLLRHYLSGRDRGFTMIEMIAVVIIIAVLSAIAAPGWLAFVNRQRVSKVNDVVFSSLQEAQREAKRTKYNYSLSLRINNTTDKIPQVAVDRYDTNNPISCINVPANCNWKNLTSEVGVKPNQVWVGTNIDPTTANNALNTLAALDTTPETIIFDQFGNLSQPANSQPPNIGPKGLMVVVAVPKPNSGTPQPIDSTKRCAIVRTLLGSIQTEQGTDCL